MKRELQVQYTSGSTPASCKFGLSEFFFKVPLTTTGWGSGIDDNTLWIIPAGGQAEFRRGDKPRTYASCHPDLLKRIGRFEIAKAIRDFLGQRPGYSQFTEEQWRACADRIRHFYAIERPSHKFALICNYHAERIEVIFGGGERTYYWLLVRMLEGAGR